jgi:hypothetical protein
MNIQNKDIQGPPFPCPECAQDGKKTTFNGRGGLGSHRYTMHNVNGTSTGSTAYKTGKLTAKSIKRTSRPYNKAPKMNPLVAMLNNPEQFVSELDVLISEKNDQIQSFYSEIAALKNSVALLERYRSTFSVEKRSEETVVISEVA